jgi:hypothetical protein
VIRDTIEEGVMMNKGDGVMKMKMKSDDDDDAPGVEKEKPSVMRLSSGFEKLNTKRRKGRGKFLWG